MKCCMSLERNMCRKQKPGKLAEIVLHRLVPRSFAKENRLCKAGFETQKRERFAPSLTGSAETHRYLPGYEGYVTDSYTIYDLFEKIYGRYSETF